MKFGSLMLMPEKPDRLRQSGDRASFAHMQTSVIATSGRSCSATNTSPGVHAGMRGASMLDSLVCRARIAAALRLAPGSP